MTAPLMARSKPYYAMFLIPFVYFAVFHYIPLLGIVIAFKQYDVFQGVLDSPWVGTRYFRQFLGDPYFYKLLQNTLLLGLYHIVFSFPAPIVLALLLNELKHRAFKRFVQTVSYLPHFLSTVVVVGILVNFLAYDGIVNRFLGLMGVEPTHFLMMPEWFRTIYIGSEIWQGVGWGSIIYLAALTAVDPQLYEAAVIDGAGRWKQTLHVTLPGIAPTVILMLLFQIGAIMGVSFEKVLLLHNGSNHPASDVISLHVYQRGLVSNDFSYATAVGLFHSVVAVTLLTIANRLSRKVTETSLW
ncbi:putative multiple-sugar transport system permease YteP [Paenibacillus solanacearum]|uniref:Multiple-sugar transport system permease YteP n=1 Tax=Paenibacillus solanacearum TaxID=2048548 RepID=A0A916NR51_9BACL|nr:ABC transporter permease subunit [Paenibacillus solanacearum]CAG7636642.1 putative multiple-sugar transport system permease YteP [Paenibacillus solanacearum]